jgi:uncharacterized protein YpuA (DUF1002 family)
MKKWIALILTLTMVVCACPIAFAANAGDACVVLGADLTEEQIAEVYKHFTLTRGELPELTVTIDEERARLGGLVDADKIGSYSLSCVFIRVLDEGEGISIDTHNIDWCTADMYKNALITAGITDAEVMITSPYVVSGTAALTGIYKAYEDITGEEISEEEKEASTQELIVTGNLAELIGSDEATQLINELKLILDETRNMTDEEVAAEISNIAQSLGVSLTDEDILQIIGLVRKLEKLDISNLQESVLNFMGTVQKMEDAGEKISSFGEKIISFFNRLIEFFDRLLA